ncbi:hypothetical protein BX600DRAFT_477807 [Xylariales sp. PMI_506]|nr:hypothetical protein BX600DRAFT_477807 [Xylariales sp. PMI_506]
MNRAHRRFDQDTGLVYRETIVQQPKFRPHRESWERRHRATFPTTPPAPKLRRGPRSLVEISLQVLCSNLNLLEDDGEVLRQVPEGLLWRIWDYFSSPGKVMNFHTWRILSKHLAGTEHPQRQYTPVAIHRYFQEIWKPDLPFSAYIRPLTSPKFEFLSHLVLAQGASFPVSELLTLPSCVNLGILEIIQPGNPEEAAGFPRVSNRIIRSWSETPGAFPCLRILRIWGEDFTTSKSLDYVFDLPSLTMYDVAGRPEDWRSRDVSHMAIKKSLFSLRKPTSRRRVWWFDDPTEGYSKALERPNSSIKYVAIPEAEEIEKRTRAIEPDSSDIGFYTAPMSPGDQLPTQTWGFVVFSHLEQLLADQDLRSQALPVDNVCVINDQYIAPPRPLVTIRLGESDRTPRSERSYKTRHVFIPDRTQPKAREESQEAKKRPADNDGRAGAFRRRKVQRMDDILSQFAL